MGRNYNLSGQKARQDLLVLLESLLSNNTDNSCSWDVVALMIDR